jgi:hypothetical protein
LIDSLITTHEYAIRVPGGGTAASFGVDGSMGGGGSVLPQGIEAGLRTGQYPNGVIVLNTPGVSMPQRTMMVAVDQQNAAVLTALQKLTGENYGYDERLWRLWWAAKKAAG